MIADDDDVLLCCHCIPPVILFVLGSASFIELSLSPSPSLSSVASSSGGMSLSASIIMFPLVLVFLSFALPVLPPSFSLSSTLLSFVVLDFFRFFPTVVHSLTSAVVALLVITLLFTAPMLTLTLTLLLLRYQQ